VSGGNQKHCGVKALIALCCCIALGAQAETFSAKVIVVMDGDTVMVLREGGSEAAGYPPASNLRRHAQKIKIRLANIDAPEKDQDFGKQSRESLLEMVGKKIVQIDSRAVDQYGRIVGLVSVDGLNVNQEQVKRGLAWAAPGWRKGSRVVPKSPDGQESGRVPPAAESSGKFYTALQNDARQARLGLWAQINPMSPWQWRKLHPSLTPAYHLDTSSPDATVTLSDMD
jgi:micrococcal nuclease